MSLSDASDRHAEASGADACAALVARDDPRLHATALFAPEPARAALMVLYAFDIELGRAAQPSSESLIPLMRLQWWRDIAEAARAGGPPPAHEVAGPFARLVVERRLPVEPVEAMIAAREVETELATGLAAGGGFDAAGFAAWADGRFGARTELAALLLVGGNDETVRLARRTGPVLGTAFALRHAVAMASAEPVLLPGLAPADRAALADGKVTAGGAAAMRAFAVPALGELGRLRAERGRAERRAAPAFLPLMRAGRVLRRAARLGAARSPSDTAPAPGLFRRTPVDPGDLDRSRPFTGLGLAWAALTGRW